MITQNIRCLHGRTENLGNEQEMRALLDTTKNLYLFYRYLSVDEIIQLWQYKDLVSCCKGSAK